MVWQIVGKPIGRDPEVFDVIADNRDAIKAVDEYRISLGFGWSINKIWVP